VPPVSVPVPLPPIPLVLDAFLVLPMVLPTDPLIVKPSPFVVNKSAVLLVIV